MTPQLNKGQLETGGTEDIMFQRNMCQLTIPLARYTFCDFVFNPLSVLCYDKDTVIPRWKKKSGYNEQR